MFSLLKNTKHFTLDISIIVKNAHRTPFMQNFCSTAAEVKGQEEQPISISKETLIKMRKETGYSYAKCRKALAKFGEQQYADALHWIKEQGIKEGWEKAAKLGSRVAMQGLYGLKAHSNSVVMVELNCETDFVAKSEDFRKLLHQLTEALAKYSANILADVPYTDTGKFNFIQIAPKDFHLPDGCSADEAIIACLARIRENIKLNSAKIIFTDPSANIFGHTHPNEEVGAVQMGRFVSLVAMKRNSDKSGFPTEKLGRQICHHIIGMVPERLGEPPVPGTSQKEKTAEETKKQTFEEGEEHEDEEDHSSEITHIEENETQLLRQAFMFNPQQTIHEYLNYHGATVSDFVRLELGQSKEAEGT